MTRRKKSTEIHGDGDPTTVAITNRVFQLSLTNHHLQRRSELEKEKYKQEKEEESMQKEEGKGYADPKVAGLSVVPEKTVATDIPSRIEGLSFIYEPNERKKKRNWDESWREGGGRRKGQG